MTPGKFERAASLSQSYDPNILRPGLKVVFCGINPAASAVAMGHNFSHASNRFWAVIHQAGFTDRQLDPAEECQLLDYGCGITAIVQQATPRANDVPLSAFEAARASFEARMDTYAPRCIAFLGKRALAGMLHQRDVAWGKQPNLFANTTAWVLPNPSGLNRNFSLEALVRSYRVLRLALEHGLPHA